MTKKLDIIIKLLEGLSCKMDRQIELCHRKSDTAESNHILWLDNQIKFYEKIRDERLGGVSKEEREEDGIYESDDIHEDKDGY